MACFNAFPGVDLADISADLSGCTLTFSNTLTGDFCYQFRLNDTIVITKDGDVKIRDGLSTINISQADLLTLGLTLADIVTAADTCRQGGAGSSPSASTVPLLTSDPAPAEGIGAWRIGDELRYLDSSNQVVTARKTSDRLNGWVQYNDTEYSTASPFVALAGQWTRIPNNAGVIIDFAAPNVGFTSFYDSATQRITVNNSGDGVLITPLLNVVSSQQRTKIQFGIDIQGSFNRIFPREITSNDSAGIEKEISFSLAGYQAATFLANGGQVFINPDHDINIYNIAYIIGRYSYNGV